MVIATNRMIPKFTSTTFPAVVQPLRLAVYCAIRTRPGPDVLSGTDEPRGPTTVGRWGVANGEGTRVGQHDVVRLGATADKAVLPDTRGPLGGTAAESTTV